ncbi:MAG: PD40 domain-containing protein, partial [Bacteroidales bacterium]|nr:PD40 domain-containing protein [Bacteroidales bacterium]
MLNIKKIIISALAFIGFAASAAQAADNTPLWMRYSAISPDGKTIAFTYQGNIFTVPAEGGRALQITTNQSYDTQPVWSPDGSKIAFASYRLGG